MNLSTITIPRPTPLYLKYSETLGEPHTLPSLASLLGTEDESMFYGALLWITLCDIGCPQLERTGWAMIDMMWRGFEENQPLEAAPGHWFRNGAAVELAAFVLPCFMFSWDAFIISSGKNFSVHISHDEFWAVVTRTMELTKSFPLSGRSGAKRRLGTASTIL